MLPEMIQFYRVRDQFGFLSNFSKHPIEIAGKTWPTTEHYFQAQKFAGTEHEEVIRLAKSPREAADMGRDRNRPLRKDWEEAKVGVMHEAVYAKFTQHKDLGEQLLSTREAILVEHTKNDSYWGDGGDGSGKNMLGRVLMQLRSNLVIEESLAYLKVLMSANP